MTGTLNLEYSHQGTKYCIQLDDGRNKLQNLQYLEAVKFLQGLESLQHLHCCWSLKEPRLPLPPAFRPSATNSAEFVDTFLFGVSTCNNIQPLDTPTSHWQTCDWVAFPEKPDPTPPVLRHSSHYRKILERLLLSTAVILHAHVHWTALSYRPFVSCMCCSLAAKHNSHAVKCFLSGWANPLSGLHGYVWEAHDAQHCLGRVVALS